MTQEPIINAWSAMQVRRWHSNADLSHTVDETVRQWRFQIREQFNGSQQKDAVFE